MSNPSGIHEGKADVYLPNVLVYLSQQVGTAVAALGEYLDNGRDAGATFMVVSLYPDRIEIFDNGHGMVPDMNPEDRDMLQLFKDEVAKGKALEEDVRDSISHAGGRSYTWLMECIAFSQKRPEKGDKVVGMRGIGMLAFRLLGATPTWYSKPSRELAEEYYGVGTAMAANSPVAVLHGLTDSAIKRNDMRYTVEMTKETILVDPLGKNHLSGTRIVITDLVPDIANIARPMLLADEFRKRYGADIRQGKLEVKIVDRLTAEGRKTPGGRVIDVEPLSYHGSLVLSEDCTLRGAPFHIELYYDSNGKNRKVALRRMGVDADIDKISLLTLPRLSMDPFNSGKLSGFVEVPILSEAVLPLNIQKTAPIESAALDEYVKIVRGYRRRIQEVIREIEARVHDRSTRDAFKSISEFAMDAIREVPVLQNLLVVPQTRTTKTHTAVVHDAITVTVFDEHYFGVENVTVELSHKGRTTQRVTGVSGAISFGRWEPGEYSIRVVVPEGMKLRPYSFDSYNSVETTEEHPGFDFKFYLVTGKPKPVKPERREINGKITITPRQLSDKNQPYSIERLGNGQIEINTEADEYSRARETGNAELRDELVANYVSLAIVEFTMHEYPAAEQFRTAALLAGKMLRLRQSAKK